MTTKNKHITSKKNKSSSSHVHVARPTVRASHRARSQSFSRKAHRASKRTILAIILLAGMTVILATLSAEFNRPENLVYRKIQSIAEDYYENHLYASIVANNSNTKPISEIMEHYVAPGFSPVYLRQLLLYDNGRNSDAASFLKSYCDENSTFIRIYPNAPFGKADYHIDYHYDCNFK